MKAFSTTGARHFVQNFTSSSGSSGTDVYKYLDQQYKKSSIIKEGTLQFDELRDCILRDADRCIYLSGSFYIRSLEGLRPSSSTLCIVGLYYSAFYAAKAILGMMGCWMKHQNMWVDVVDANPGNQRIHYHKDKYSGPKGSHRIFWHAYYTAVTSLLSWMPPQTGLAFRPISSNEYWFIELRNKVNYSPYEAFLLVNDFDAKFDKNNVPNCFPGELNTAYQVTNSFMTALRELSKYTGLKADVFLQSRSRKSEIKKKITGSKPLVLTRFARNSCGDIEF